MLLSLAVIAFSLTACGGGVLAVLRLRGGSNPPAALALGHGLLALTGFGLLIGHCVAAGWPRMPTIALGVLVTAAAMGLATARHQAQGRLIPLGVILGHATIAIFGLALLIVTAVARSMVPPP